MLYEFLKIVVLVFGPVAAYTVLRATLEVPELIVELPIIVRRTIEVVGAIFIVGAWFVAYVGPLSAPMALIGLMLLATPFTAQKLSQSKAAYLEA